VNLAVALHGKGARWLVRCDAHANYPIDFLRLLIETQARTGADSVVVPMDSIGCTRFQKAVAWVSDSLVGSGGSAHRGGHVSGFVDHGHHALIAMDLFQRVGGYDESFTHNEDAEFDCRLRALGGSIYLDGRIRLEYHPRDSFHRLWRQYFNYGKGRSRTVRRHPTSLRPRQFAVPSFLALCLACLLAAPFRIEALLLPFVYCAALAATSLQVMLKHRSLCGLLAGPVAGVMHAAWACGFYAGLIKTREARWQPDDAQTMAKAA
jgi:succinoglycan biosynthesis protein ExoA